MIVGCKLAKQAMYIYMYIVYNIPCAVYNFSKAANIEIKKNDTAPKKIHNLSKNQRNKWNVHQNHFQNAFLYILDEGLRLHHYFYFKPYVVYILIFHTLMISFFKMCVPLTDPGIAGALHPG